ncbi:GPCR fungal pheromone mating factor [Lactifluus volemus]|nr:GPCR fungal pheromone mating factor [Lactifluus volemus]
MRLELPVLSFVSIALLILILPGQVHTFSIPSVSIIAWFFLCNLIHGINAILWSGNQNVQAPLWCDISSVVLLGAMVALPGCFLCISRRLEAITSIHMVDQKRGKTFDRSFEAVVCFLFPALYMSLHTIVQDHRFVILEDYGCQAAVYNSLPALIIVWSPPLCISVIGILYCLSAVINVSKHRERYTSSRSKPEISLSLFTRRIAFAIGGMLYVAVVYAFVLSSIATSGLLPWLSVSQTRSQVMDIDTVPSPSQMSIQSELIWWFIPVWSLLLCILCAFGKETQNGYHSTFNWLSRRFHGDISILPMQYVLQNALKSYALTPHPVSDHLPQPSRFTY